MRMASHIIIGTLLLVGQGAAALGQSQRGGVPPVERAWRNDSVLQKSPSSRVDAGSVSQDSFGFYWETRLEPPSPKLPETFESRTVDSNGAIIRRFLLDHSARTYFGYEATVVVLKDPNTFSIAFKSLVMTAELAQLVLRESPSGWMALPAPQFPPAQTIHGGDILALNLLTNGATSQRIVDYVTVQEPARKFSGFDIRPDRTFTYATGAARDFRADDVELQLQSPRLVINGKLEESSTDHFGTSSGSVVWFYAPGRGRFILSLAPHPQLGFRKAGEVRGTSLSFTLGNDTFVVNCGSRIAPGQAAFNLYVLHDPAWRPDYAFADLSKFIMGGADRAEELVRR